MMLYELLYEYWTKQSNIAVSLIFDVFFFFQIFYQQKVCMLIVVPRRQRNVFQDYLISHV